MDDLGGVTASLRGLLFDPTIGKLLTAAIGAVVILAIARVARRSLRRAIVEPKSRFRVGKFVSFASYFAIFLFLTIVFQERLGNLTTALGVAGAGVAFALQEVIASAAGWIAILFGRFYSTGDRVQLGGIRGDVLDIGVLRTTLMECGEWVRGDLYNGRVVRVANSFIFKEPVFNYSADFPFLWDEIRIPIRHGSDHRLARNILAEVAERVVGDYARGAAGAWNALVERYGIEKMQVAPMVTLVANDNWIELTLRYAVDLRRRRMTQDALFTAVLDAIDATGGKVQLASATFEIVRSSSIETRVAGNP